MSFRRYQASIRILSNDNDIADDSPDLCFKITGMKQITLYALLGCLSFATIVQATHLNETKAMTYLIDNNGDQLFTTVYPNEGRETVILLHGGPGFPSDLTEVATQLSEKYQVITFHQRGTRQSPCKSHDYSMLVYISDVDAVAQYFKVDKFHLFGHSWGGLYAQIYAQEHPERLLSLFLCCPGSGTGEEWKQTEKEVMQLNRSKCSSYEWMKMGVNNLLGILGSDKAYMRLFKQVMKNYNEDFIEINDQSADFSNLKADPINKTRKEIVKYPLLSKNTHPAYPITVVYGEMDIYQTSKNFVLGRYPTATVQIIDHSGHIPWLHNPEKYRTVLAAHFR